MKTNSEQVGTNEATNQDIERQTTDAVEKLNDTAKANATSWLEAGRVIHEFAIKTEIQREDCFKKLANHPDCLLQAGQLRNYYACYQLCLKIGQTDILPVVTMTHFICVLGASINIKDKFKLLKIAEKENLSVSQFKARIKEYLQGARQKQPKSPPQKGEVSPDVINWNTNIATLDKLMQRTISTVTAMTRIAADKEVPEAVRSNIRNAITLIIAKGLVEKEVVQSLLNAPSGSVTEGNPESITESVIETVSTLEAA